MAAKLDTTSTPGIFRRHAKDCARGGAVRLLLRDPCTATAAGSTWRPSATFAEAREAQRTRGSQVARGEFTALARVTLHDYAREWIDRYQGTGRRGFREETRDEYRAHLEKYTLRYFPPQDAAVGDRSADGGRLHRLAGEAAEPVEAARWPTRRCATLSSRSRPVSPRPGGRA